MTKWNNSRGAVSIFIVIFSALLITTIAVGFIRLMIQGQQQATSSDLSQSALNSAQAGVEDAKRALVRYQNYCLGSPTAMATAECVRLDRALKDGTQCNTIQESGIAGNSGDSEVVVRQELNEADSQLQQAYTCVKIQTNTADYIGQLPLSGSRMVPLRATGDFNKIEIEWFSQADLKDSQSDDTSVESISLSNDELLPPLSEWEANRPAMLRTQLIQFGSSFQLSDFDKNEEGASNAHTLFLNPSEVGRDTLSFSDDARLSALTGSLQQIACDRNFTTASTDRMYACKATISLPNALGQSDLRRTAYLRLNALYNKNTSFRIKLMQDATPVTFSSVQPIVDSTGRANDLFRRIQSRVEIDNSTFPFPQASVELSGGLCKTFLVTDKTADYTEGTCGL